MTRPSSFPGTLSSATNTPGAPHLAVQAGQILPRQRFLDAIQAAIKVQESRFAGQAALSWLSAYPGDLLVSLYYAQSLLGQDLPRQALPILEGLCQADPEFLEAYETLLTTRRSLGLPPSPPLTANLLALGGLTEYPGAKNNTAPNGKPGTSATIDDAAPWGRPLWLARLALKKNDPGEAGQLIQQAIGLDPQSPLVAVTHLQVLEAQTDAPLESRLNLANFYHRRWPDCLQCTLLLADWLIISGDSDQAVALLHQAVARDTSGQSAIRLWGPRHPYRSMWPEKMEARLKTILPAKVAAVLGWNLLPEGGSRIADKETYPDGTQPAVEQASSAGGVAEGKPGLAATLETAAMGAELGAATSFVTPKSAQVSTAAPQPATTQFTEVPITFRETPEELRLVQDEFERLAGSLNRSGLTRTDGRFPIYVILSTRRGLETLYGAKGAAEIETEINRLVDAVRNRPGWGARVFFPDEPASVTPLGIKPARPNDPWGIKLALTDLDAALGRRGEMIGAVLIVGGPEIVPFHQLPNPVDDVDSQIASDNPYASRDENYFIPEWPVGRVPGGAGNDPNLLLSLLRGAADQHIKKAHKPVWYLNWWENISYWFRNRLQRQGISLGYTAAIWRNASSSVFRPIGNPRAMVVCPPHTINGNGNGAAEGTLDSSKSTALPPARLGYFNLHGVLEAAEWYGQSDSNDHDGSDYPAALQPADVFLQQKNRPNGVPQVVFSEACYGLHIDGKNKEQALSLAFLSVGTQAVVGSTATSYGSISAYPLNAADYLGNSFWSYVREGLPAGVALQRAKVQLAQEMNRRQGYLDGEDQKTLISFIMFGDPLATPDGPSRVAKSVVRPVKPTIAKIICDRAAEEDDVQSIPPEVIIHVKRVVEQYLPGMVDAKMVYSHERAQCSSHNHRCPTAQMKHKSAAARTPQRQLVTLSKQIQLADHTYQQYARLTLDPDGQLVKLVVSR